MKERVILSIDVKSFFASCECIERGLDLLKTALVVADRQRAKSAMTLAVSPYLRSIGVKSRSRVFQLPNNINIMIVNPRINLYEKYSKKIIDVYLEFVSKDDIHVYSIDEVFIDITTYIKLYRKTDIEIAKDIMNRVKEKTGLITTCGIGPNIFLSKVAMDIEAKNNSNFIAKWDYKDIENKLWEISPLSKIWGFGNKTEKKLNNLGIIKVKDINKYKRDFYIKRFGKVMGNDIWCKANGIYFTTIQDFNLESKNKSISMDQTFYKDYNIDDTIQILKEMTEMLCSKLRSTKKMTKLVYLKVIYSKELYKYFKDSILLNSSTDSQEELFEIISYMYNKNVENLPIRKVSISFLRLDDKKYYQINIFEKDYIDTDYEYNKKIDNIINKFGQTSILKASSLLNNSTIKKRKEYRS